MAGKYGQVAQGNDYHRRERDLVEINRQIAANAQRRRNIREWLRRARAAYDAGNLPVFHGICDHLSKGFQ
jgi:hypothetical protein